VFLLRNLNCNEGHCDESSTKSKTRERGRELEIDAVQKFLWGKEVESQQQLEIKQARDLFVKPDLSGPEDQETPVK